jgi:hypothetical protein
MYNGSSLDLTYNPTFDRWFFGKLPEGQTMVQGGIIAYGLNNKLYGSPGVALYNEVVIGSADYRTRTGGKPAPREELFGGIAANTPETNLQ